MSSVSLINGHIDDDGGMEMTDKDIIKALECCTGLDFGKCAHCHLIHTVGCSSKLLKYSFDLINRQKAEIERQNDIIHRQSDVISEQKEKIDRIYAEAVIEFTERIERKDFTGGGYHLEIDRETWDEIKKEMVGNYNDR